MELRNTNWVHVAILVVCGVAIAAVATAYGFTPLQTLASGLALCGAFALFLVLTRKR